MANAKRGLGRGLGALIPGADENIYKSREPEVAVTGVVEIDINKIIPNKEQPRKIFDKDKIEALSASIREHGIIQPLVVNRDGDKYKIIAGERRWRAAKQAHLAKVPVVIKDISKKEVMQLSLIENIQREDLNPIEEANAYESLINEFGFTHEALGESVGKSRSAITNSLRLLRLSDKCSAALSDGEITVGHAKVILGISDNELADEVVERIISDDISVKDTEKLIKRLSEKKEILQKEQDREFEEAIKTVENRLSGALMTKVKLNAVKDKGKIIIDYYSNEELDRLIDIFERANGK